MASSKQGAKKGRAVKKRKSAPAGKSAARTKRAAKQAGAGKKTVVKKAAAKKATKAAAKSPAKRPATKAAKRAPKPNPWFEIRKSGIQGRGGFALKRIPKGTRIAEYTGERISQDVANSRYDDDTMGRHHTFLFTLDDDTVVDGAVGGSDARFINHSCAPNCEAVIERRRIWIEAIRDIKANEELVYDYQYERTSDHGPEDERMYKCRCGAKNCRGTILAPTVTA